jgi:hypothetical protein
MAVQVNAALSVLVGEPVAPPAREKPKTFGPELPLLRFSPSSEAVA